MWSSKGKVAIVGVGYSKIGRGLDDALGALTAEACSNAINDAGLKPADIDGIATTPAALGGGGNIDGRDTVSCNYMIQHFELRPDVRWYTETTGMEIATVIECVNALVAGACNYVLYWRALSRPAGTYGAVRSDFATGDSQFLTPYGFGGAFAPHALTFKRYAERYGVTREMRATQAVTQRAHANRNPHAYFHEQPLTRDEYMNSRMISDPLCLFDCDIPVEGAVALVLTTADRAKDLKQRPAYVAGYGQNTDRRPTLIQYTLVDYMKSGHSIAQKIFGDAGIGPKDVDVAELYDGFAPSAMYWLESAGFCKEGEAYQFIQNGNMDINGELPVNTNGGALSEGRLHSVGHLIEGALQVTGRGGTRQVPNCNVAYITAGSPMLRGAGMLLSSQP